mmetsp:Transcript_435/g.1705  ORF Transcript_435/g.1705 Transcript_435/m.1705 type:complete len:220 (-) Transcript_435:54-713(-)
MDLPNPCAWRFGYWDWEGWTSDDCDSRELRLKLPPIPDVTRVPMVFHIASGSYAPGDGFESLRLPSASMAIKESATCASSKLCDRARSERDVRLNMNEGWFFVRLDDCFPKLEKGPQSSGRCEVCEAAENRCLPVSYISTSNPEESLWPAKPEAPKGRDVVPNDAEATIAVRSRTRKCSTPGARPFRVATTRSRRTRGSTVVCCVGQRHRGRGADVEVY